VNPKHTLLSTSSAPADPRLLASRPIVTIDLVSFTVTDGALCVLLQQCTAPPFEGTWSLLSGPLDIGGISGEQGEDITESAHRLITAHTGLPASVEQLHTFGRANRDPRWRALSISWIAMIGPEWADTAASHDAIGTNRWFKVEDELPWIRLAFDHAEILAAGVAQLQQNLQAGTQVYDLVPQQYTVAELQSAHEAICGSAIDDRTFRRRFCRLVEDGVVVQAPGMRHRGRARPAKIWRLATSAAAQR
jgi:8-oxo-dGTP diphosphatase